MPTSPMEVKSSSSPGKRSTATIGGVVANFIRDPHQSYSIPGIIAPNIINEMPLKARVETTADVTVISMDTAMRLKRSSSHHSKS